MCLYHIDVQMMHLKMCAKHRTSHNNTIADKQHKKPFCAYVRRPSSNRIRLGLVSMFQYWQVHLLMQEHEKESPGGLSFPAKKKQKRIIYIYIYRWYMIYIDDYFIEMNGFSLLFIVMFKKEGRVRPSCYSLNWAQWKDGFKMFFQVNVEKTHNATIINRSL